MPASFNIDIHCHPSTKPFMSGVQAKRHSPFETYRHRIESPILKLLEGYVAKIAEVELATQSNFDNLFEGDFKVVIASITPMEKGFFVSNKKVNGLTGDLAVIQTRPPFEGTIRPQIINALMGFGVEDIKFVRGSGSFKDYYTQGFQREYDFLVETHGKISSKHGYRIVFVNSFEEIRQGMETDEKIVFVIVSVEGGHSLSKNAPNIREILNGQDKSHINDPENFTGLKDYEDNIIHLKQLPFPPLFITLMHHFWNGLGGHARSLNKMVSNLLSQQEGINTGLTALGRQVIKRLLDTTNGKRIFIDVKHMSAKSRKQFYALLHQPPYSNEIIPIICSHAGIVSKITKLDEFIQNESDPQRSDEAEENNMRNYLHECSINLCAEDVIEITRSGGLIGIQLDEKRVAGSGFINFKLRGGITRQVMIREYVKVLLANIFTAVGHVNDLKAWDVFSIGSDFDGLINHLDCCPTAAHVTINIRKPLLDFLLDPEDIRDPLFDFIMTKEQMHQLMFGLSAERIVEKIFSENVMNFLEKNFK